MCTISKEIHGKFKVDISKLLFYHGARAPGKTNMALPLPIDDCQPNHTWKQQHFLCGYCSIQKHLLQIPAMMLSLVSLLKA